MSLAASFISACDESSEASSKHLDPSATAPVMPSPDGPKDLIWFGQQIKTIQSAEYAVMQAEVNLQDAEKAECPNDDAWNMECTNEWRMSQDGEFKGYMEKINTAQERLEEALADYNAKLKEASREILKELDEAGLPVNEVDSFATRTNKFQHPAEYKNGIASFKEDVLHRDPYS